jgi:hypothetical protein
VLTAGGEHGLVAVAVGAEPALPDSLFPVVDDLDGRGTLVRVHADDDLRHPDCCSSLRQWLSARRASLL